MNPLDSTSPRSDERRFGDVSVLASDSANALAALQALAARMRGTLPVEVPLEGPMICRVQFDWQTAMDEWLVEIQEAITASEEVRLVAGRALRVAQRADETEGIAQVCELSEVEARLALILKDWLAALNQERNNSDLNASGRPIPGYLSKRARELLLGDELVLQEWSTDEEDPATRWCRLSHRFETIALVLARMCKCTSDAHRPFTGLNRLYLLSESFSEYCKNQAAIWSGLFSLTEPLGDPMLDRHDAILQLEIEYLASHAVPPPGIILVEPLSKEVLESG